MKALTQSGGAAICSRLANVGRGPAQAIDKLCRGY